MKLYQKLLLGFACVALLVSCVGYVAQQTNQSVQRGVTQLSQTGLAEIAAAGDLSSHLRQSATAAARLSSGSPDHAAAREELATALEQFEIALMAARSATAAGRSRAEAWNLKETVTRQDAKLRSLDQLGNQYNQLRQAAHELATAPYDEQGNQAIAIQLAVESIAAHLDEYRRSARRDLSVVSADVQRSLAQADRFLFVAVLLGIGITLVLGVLISNSIVGPLNVLADATRLMGSGRFDHRVRVRSSSEVTHLAEALNKMAEELGATTISKRFLDNILESMSDPLFVLDEEGRIVLANAAVARTLGYEIDELVGLSIGQLLAEGDLGADKIVRLVRQWGATGNIEMSLRTHEGAELPMVVTGSLMVETDEGPQQVVCVAKDITEQKRVERELLTARERAEEMARLKSSFLANMSHEIRTPLTGIIGSAQVLREVTEDDALEMAEIIERAGVRLLSTINSVLDMARIEAGELQPRMEAVPLAEEVRDAIRVLDRLAEAKNLSLEVEERARDVMVLADPTFINRITMNLVGNAIKFTESGGVVVEIDQDEDGSPVMRVRDSGIGISEEFLPHLFEEFRQASTGFQRSHEGSGLGLAITKRLVDLLDGEIDVESGRTGTTFIVRLRTGARPRLVEDVELAAQPLAEA